MLPFAKTNNCMRAVCTAISVENDRIRKLTTYMHGQKTTTSKTQNTMDVPSIEPMTDALQNSK